MWTFLARFLGLAMFLGAAAALVYLTLISFVDSREWMNILLAVGMPLMYVLFLGAFAVAGLGLWMFLRLGRRARA